MADYIENDIETIENETALATYGTPGQIASFSDALMTDVTEQGYWASFPVETMEDKKILFAARKDNLLLKDHMNEIIPMVGLVLDIQVVSDPVQGPKNVPCVHIISDDGKVYQSLSAGVVNYACDIISNFGLPETWDGPINVMCKETTTAKGYRFKYLAVI